MSGTQMNQAPPTNSAGLLDWTAQQPAVDYFAEENVKYERRFIDVDSMGDGFQVVAINFDTTHYASLMEDKKVAIHEHKDCSVGSFWVPFAECGTKEELIYRISKFVVTFGNHSTLNPRHIRVYVFRHIDPQGKRFFAIGGTNLFLKDAKIHKLRLRTMQRMTVAHRPDDAWDILSREIGNFQEDTNCVVIDKQELLPFEERVVPVSITSKDVLILCHESEDFAAHHYDGPSSNQYVNTKENDKGSVFKLRTIRFSSIQEVNQRIRWLSEAFRTLTGCLAVKIVAQITELPGNAIDASVVAYQHRFDLLETSDEDEPSF